MLTELQVFGSRTSAASMALAGGGIDDDPLQIRDIDGLDPVKAAISTSPYGSRDGEYNTGNSVAKRNIVLTVGLNPNWADQTIASLRQILYAYFMPKFPVRLRFLSTHLPPVQISGIVEGCTPNIFSKDPEMQVSIICPEPDFIAVSPTLVTGLLRSTNPTYGTPSYDTIDYEGTVETGIELQLYMNPSGLWSPIADEVTLSNRSPTEETFVFDGAISGTNVFKLSTVRGSKYARLYHADGSYVNELRSVELASTWLQLKPGENKFMVKHAGDPNNLWKLVYYARFGGL